MGLWGHYWGHLSTGTFGCVGCDSNTKVTLQRLAPLGQEKGPIRGPERSLSQADLPAGPVPRLPARHTAGRLHLGARRLAQAFGQVEKLHELLAGDFTGDV